MEKVNQRDLVKKIAEETGVSQAEVKNILLNAAAQVVKYANRGRAVVLPGLGFFKPVERAGRIGRNPKTKEAFDIPAKRVLTFKVSRKVILDSE